MQVNLLHSTPLWVASTAIRKCWASEGKSDSPKCCTNTGLKVSEKDIRCNVCGHHFCECAPFTGEKDKELINRIGNKYKHASTLEHLVYSFDIDGISRACLQEVARHRMASYSVKSTRYTLKELKKANGYDELMSFLLPTGNKDVDRQNVNQLDELQWLLIEDKISNDRAKYMLPEAYKTSLVMTINARSLQNFLALRTSKSALWEIRDLANAMFEQLPEDHKYLFEEHVND